MARLTWSLAAASLVAAVLGACSSSNGAPGSGTSGDGGAGSSSGGSGSSSGGGSGSGSGGGSGSSSGGSLDGSTDGSTTPHCNETGLSTTATPFALPLLTEPLDDVGGVNNGCTGTASQVWTSLDLTGDGKLDLVLTQSCTDSSVGIAHWLVYPNTGSGFSSAATSFALPSLTEPLDTVSGTNNGCTGTASQEWTTLDLTGDGKLDLVLTQSCTDTTVGTAQWLVYPSTSSGFSTTATPFVLPVLTEPLDTVGGANNGCTGTASQQWTTLDLTGDGKLDLVLTESCTDASVGTAHWLVYANTGTGFSTSATSFALPSETEPLDTVSGANNGCTGTASQKWSTFDLTGDGKLDLVLTQSCTDNTVGTAQWLVYANTGSGFATTSTPFTLPPLTMPLDGIGGVNSGCTGTASQEWTSLDLTGDGKPDLVLTQACTDVSVGMAHWLVYPNTGSGFSSTPTSFTLPSVTEPFDAVGGVNNGCTGTASQIWSSVDLTGDGKLDLVLTESCTDAMVGVSQWSVYPGVCAP